MARFSRRGGAARDRSNSTRGAVRAVNDGRRRLSLERLEDRRVLAADLGLGSVSGFNALAVEPTVEVDPFPVDDAYVAGGLPAEALTGPGTSVGSALEPATLADTFHLHSRPGASKVIYLDFDGHTTTGTTWNTAYNGGAAIVTPAYSFEGDTSFSSAEQTRIVAIWERVSEDYLPFDVDVTTEDPGLNALRKSSRTDSQYGVRVAIGGSWSDWYGTTAGGVAYVGSFDDATDTPVFIFADDLGFGSEKSVAEAITHEAGHSLGLNHDGQTGGTDYYAGHGNGATGWAPIMGVGYSKSLTQWSKGEYPNANNTQDDLSTIVQTTNGFTYRADDRGNTIATATPLTVTSGSVFGEGVIERRTDLDYFSFTTVAGPVNLTISPAAKGPNLDILASLYNSGGVLVATSNPVDSLGASFSQTLAAGVYYVSIDGTSKAANGADYGYSDYGSLGYYSITGTLASAVTTGTIDGSVYHDLDRSATRDLGEGGLAGWTVYIDANNNGVADVQNTALAWTLGPQALVNGGFKTTTVNVSGTAGPITDVNVTFDLSHGSTYELSIQLTSPDGTTVDLVQAGDTLGADLTGTTLDDQATVMLLDGASPYTATFKPASPLAAFNGASANGVWMLTVSDIAGGSTGTLNSWSLDVQTATETRRTTDANGAFSFAALSAGSYTIRELVQEGWDQTAPALGNGTGGAQVVSVVAGLTTANIDFGNAEVVIVAPSADFNGDHAVDGSDFLAWQRGLATPAATHAEGDANFDAAVNGVDLTVWSEQFGVNNPPQSGLVMTSAAAASATVAASDAGATPTLVGWTGLDFRTDEAASAVRRGATTGPATNTEPRPSPWGRSVEVAPDRAAAFASAAAPPSRRGAQQSANEEALRGWRRRGVEPAVVEEFAIHTARRESALPDLG